MEQQLDHSGVKAILNVLREKIARRTSEDEASSMLSQFIEELTPKYDFLKHVSMNKSVYSETETIWVSHELNQVSEKEVFSALHDLVQKSIREMKEKADFFFIREFQEAFKDIQLVRKTETDDLPLNEMQHEYLINRTRTLSLEKNQLLINMIHALLSISNKYLSEAESVHLIQQALRELLSKYFFFHSVTIAKHPDSQGYYTVELTDNVQKIPTYQFADALYQLIIYIGTELKIENAEEFGHELKQKLGKRNTELLRKVNVSIDHVYISTSSITKKDIMKQLINALIGIVGDRTSRFFAVAVLKEMMEKVEKNNSIFEKILLQKDEKAYDISFTESIESATNEEFRKSIKSIIEAVGSHLGRKKGDFITELKKNLGTPYVTAIEKTGLNFHILEMKFN